MSGHTFVKNIDCSRICPLTKIYIIVFREYIFTRRAIFILLDYYYFGHVYWFISFRFLKSWFYFLILFYFFVVRGNFVLS
jgi:hypothetical protein